ncbi:MAG: EAL domain-containing protein [Bulleidia sp.]|nr:EAL domain-containing protein [Bulleidia sp.]
MNLQIVSYELRNYSLLVQAFIFVWMNDRMFFRELPAGKRLQKGILSFLVSFHTSFYLAYRLFYVFSSFTQQESITSFFAVTAICIVTVVVMLPLYKKLINQDWTLTLFLYLIYVMAHYLATLVSITILGKLAHTQLITLAVLFWFRKEVRKLSTIQYHMHASRRFNGMLMLSMSFVIAQAQAPRLVLSGAPHAEAQSDFEWVLAGLSLAFTFSILLIMKLFLNAVFRYEEYFDMHEKDPLTDLYNRSYYQEHAWEKIDEAFSAGKKATIFSMNIHGFHDYNSMYGFEAGDMLLQHLSDSLRNEFPDGLLSRDMADHFIGVVIGDDIQARIKGIHESMHLLQKQTTLQLLTGLYEVKDLPQKKDSAVITKYLDNADAAMKSMFGQPLVDTVYFNEKLQKEAELRIYVLEHIDEAVEKGWIQTYYQPCIDIHTGKLYQYEALARWIDPMHGYLRPDQFIPVLENNYLVYKVDFKVLENACRTMQETGHLFPVSFNLSRTDFESADVLKNIVDISDHYGISRSFLHAEITESAMNNDNNVIRKAIDDLHGIGCEVWMDDFGSGFSSLNVLKDYPFDVIKIDMVFMRNFSKRSEDVVKAVTGMNKELGLRTLCEGVETKEQMDFLHSIGCDIAQGYLFSKPLPYEEVSQLEFGMKS